MDNKPYLLALNQISHVGPIAVKRLLKKCPDLSELFSLSKSQLSELNVSESIAQAIVSFNFDCVKKEMEWNNGVDQHVLTWCDRQYPALLKEIADPPIVLYAKGDLTCLKQPTVAMVGSRKPSISGRETAHRFAFELAERQMTIVSGLALGIDAHAHQGCLDAGGKTIAVLGSGLECVYPWSHVHLAKKICQNGLLVSEFSLKTPPIAGHFPRRNRIISGLSLVILVVEAAIRSGSLITARLALEQNRDVLAVPGSIHNPTSQGCHHLLQQGARLVVSSADVLDALGLEYERFLSEHRTLLADEDHNLVQYLGFETTTIDQILERSGLPLEQLMCGLAELEIEGVVKMVPGGYMRC